MLFEWDHAKAALNLAKHGVEFEDAVHLFDDPFSVEEHQNVGGEERWKVIGTIGNHLLVVVVEYKTASDDEPVVRLISARKAKRHERKDYQETHRP